MERSEITRILKKLEPALATKDLIQVFACFCLDGEQATAYDGVVALSHPLNIGLKGAVRGKVLLSFLGACRAKELKIETGDGSTIVKAGRSKLDTPVLPEEDFIFKFPGTKNAVEFSANEAFMKALSKSLISLGRDPTHRFRLGVTVVFKKNKLTMYSSDNRTATRIHVKLKEEGPEKLVIQLPPRFCELLHDINREDSVQTILMTKKWIQAKFESGLRLFSQAISDPEPETFVRLFESSDDEKLEKQMLPIPKGFDRSLDRALVVLPYSNDPYTKLKIKEDKIILTTDSEAGNVRDALTLNVSDSDHPDCEASLAPEQVLRGLEYAEKFCIIPGSCLVVRAPGYTYLVTVLEGQSAQEDDNEAAE